MKINEVTEGVWQGIKSIGKDIASVATKAVGTGLPRERKISSSLQKQIIANNQSLARLISDLRGERYPTESELTQYFINKGWSSNQAKDNVNAAFTTIADTRNKAEAAYPTASPVQVAKLVMTKFYKNQKKQDQEDLAAYASSTGNNTANLAKALVAKGAVDMLPSKQSQPAQQAASEIVGKIKAVSGDPLVYQYGKQQYHLNGRGNWAKFPNEKEVPQTIAALLNQAADRDGY